MPNNGLSTCTYSTASFSHVTKNFSYSESISIRISTYGLLIFMMVWWLSESHSFNSVCTNALGMSHVAISQPSCASITPVSIVASVSPVGLETSSISIHCHWESPSDQYLALNFPSFFSVRKVSDSNALLQTVSLSELKQTSLKNWRSYNSCILSLAAALPSIPTCYHDMPLYISEL